LAVRGLVGDPHHGKHLDRRYHLVARVNHDEHSCGDGADEGRALGLPGHVMTESRTRADQHLGVLAGQDGVAGLEAVPRLQLRPGERLAAKLAVVAQLITGRVLRPRRPRGEPAAHPEQDGDASPDHAFASTVPASSPTRSSKAATVSATSASVWAELVTPPV